MTKRKVTTASFIEKAKSKHGDVYDYSEATYEAWNVPIKIICKRHGLFEQRPNNHTSGKGCPDCALERLGRSPKLNTVSVVEKAREVHGDRYDYSQVTYVSAHVPMAVCCKKHGVFQQSYSNHVLGKKGCPKCGEDSVADIKRKSLEVFIEQSKEVHDGYSYALTSYVNNATKLTLICPNAHVYEEVPHKHLDGRACPECLRLKLLTYSTYLFELETGGFKIGISYNVQRRYKQFRTHYPEAKIVKVWEMGTYEEAADAERRLLKELDFPCMESRGSVHGFTETRATNLSADEMVRIIEAIL